MSVLTFEESNLDIFGPDILSILASRSLLPVWVGRFPGWSARRDGSPG